MYVSLWDPGFNSFGHIPRSGIAGSIGSSLFNFLRNFHAVSNSGCTSLTSHYQYIRILFLPYLHQYLFSLFYFVLLIVIPGGMKYYFAVVLIWFLWWLLILSTFIYVCMDICVSSLENVYLDPLPIFFSWVIIIFLCWVIWAPNIFWILDIWIADIFYHFMDCLFTLLFLLPCIGIIPKKSLARLKCFSLMFSSRSFMVSGLVLIFDTFRLIFV